MASEPKKEEVQMRLSIAKRVVAQEETIEGRYRLFTKFMEEMGLLTHIYASEARILDPEKARTRKWAASNDQWDPSEGASQWHATAQSSQEEQRGVSWQQQRQHKHPRQPPNSTVTPVGGVPREIAGKFGGKVWGGKFGAGKPK